MGCISIDVLVFVRHVQKYPQSGLESILIEMPPANQEWLVIGYTLEAWLSCTESGIKISVKTCNQ